MNQPTITTARARKRGLILRIAGSVTVLALLIWLVGEGSLARLRAMEPLYLLAACGALGGVIVCNGIRWQLLLRGYQIPCRAGEAIYLYTVSLFFTLFLPGSAGSDAVRAFYIARQYGRLVAVLLATLQERLVSLGGLLLVGVSAVALLREQLGVQLALTLALVQLGTLCAVVTVLFPAPLIALGRKVWILLVRWRPAAALVQRIGSERIEQFILPAASRRLSRVQVALLVLAVCWSTIFGLATYWLLGLALDLYVPWLALCIAVPVVTLARILPISLNGIGVGEGAFVVMLQPFGIPQADAFALSLAGLAIHTLAGLVGGLLYALMLNQGVQIKLPQEVEP